MYAHPFISSMVDDWDSVFGYSNANDDNIELLWLETCPHSVGMKNDMCVCDSGCLYDFFTSLFFPKA